MTQPHVLELAKQGDPNAIATLMNQSLQPRGMTALVDRQGDVLEVVLEAERVPNRDALTAFVQKGIDSLGVDSIRSVRVVGQQTGSTFPAWMQELNLASEFSSESAIAESAIAPPIELDMPAVTLEADLAELDRQTLEMLDLLPATDTPRSAESLPDTSSLGLSDRSFEPSFSSFSAGSQAAGSQAAGSQAADSQSTGSHFADSRQQTLEAQLESLWTDQSLTENADDLSIAPSEPISEAEFQDLFAEDSPEALDSAPSDVVIEDLDLFTEEEPAAPADGAIEDLFGEEDPAAIGDLFTEEEPAAPADGAIEDLFGGEEPAAIGDLFTGEEPAAPADGAIEDLFGGEEPAVTDELFAAEEEPLVSGEESETTPTGLFGSELFGLEAEEPLSPSAESTASADLESTDLFGEAPVEGAASLDSFQTFFVEDDSEESESIALSADFETSFETDFAADFTANDTLEDSTATLSRNFVAEESPDTPSGFGEELDTAESPESGLSELTNESLQSLFDSEAPLEDLSDPTLAAPVESTYDANEFSAQESLDFSLDELNDQFVSDRLDSEPVASDHLSEHLTSPDSSAQPEDFANDLSANDLSANNLSDDFFAEATPSELAGSKEPIAEDWMTELQGLNETPIEYVFGAEASLEATPEMMSETAIEQFSEIEPSPEDTDSLDTDSLAGLAGIGAISAVAATSIDQFPDQSNANQQDANQQGLEAQIDSLWAEQTEEPMFELEEELIDADPMESDPMESDPMEADLMGSSEVSDASLAALFDEAPTHEASDDEPILLMEDTLEAPPDGELPLEENLPAIEENLPESATLDAAFQSEISEELILPPPNWADDLLDLSNEPASLMDESANLPAELTLEDTVDRIDSVDLSNPTETPDVSSFDFSGEESLSPTEDATNFFSTDDPEEPNAAIVDLPAEFLEDSLEVPDDFLEAGLDAEPSETALAADLEPTDLEFADLEPTDLEPANLSSPDLSFLDEAPDEPIATLIQDPMQEDLELELFEPDPAAAPTLPPMDASDEDEDDAMDSFETELAGLTLDDLPEDTAAEFSEAALSGVDASSPESASTEAVDFMADSSDSDLAEPVTDLDLSPDFFDVPTVSSAQASTAETDAFYDLPSDLLDLPDEANPSDLVDLFPEATPLAASFSESRLPDSMEATLPPQFRPEETIDFLDSEAESASFATDPTDLSDADLESDPGSDPTDLLDADLESDLGSDPAAEPESYSAEINFLTDEPIVNETEIPTESEDDRFLQSSDLPTDLPPEDSASDELDEVDNLALNPSDDLDEADNLALDPDDFTPNAFTEEDTAIADTNGWETDSPLPDYAEGMETNGMHDAAVVAAGLVGTGGLAGDRESEGGTTGNGRDYATAGTIEVASSPWLYTIVLLGVSSLIAGLLGYSLWSEIVTPTANPDPSAAPPSTSPAVSLPQEMLQVAMDEVAADEVAADEAATNEVESSS
jgi:hypothetical protein